MSVLSISLVLLSLLQYSTAQVSQQNYLLNLNSRLVTESTSTDAISSTQNLLDDDPSTDWQSADKVESVNITLSPIQVRNNYVVTIKEDHCFDKLISIIGWRTARFENFQSVH